MNIRKQYLYRFNKILASEKVNDLTDWAFRLLYGLPKEVQRDAVRFMFRRYLKVVETKWPKIKKSDRMLDMTEEDILAVDDWYWNVSPDNVNDELYQYYSAFEFFEHSYSYPEAATEKSNETAIITGACTTAITEVTWAWRETAESENPVFCEIPDYLKVEGEELPESIQRREWGALCSWLIDENIWNYPDLENWKNAEKALLYWVAEYMYYNSFFNGNYDFYDECHGVANQRIPKWEELLPEDTEGDPQAHLPENFCSS